MVRSISMQPRTRGHKGSIRWECRGVGGPFAMGRHSARRNPEGYGPTAFARKAIEENRLGKTICRFSIMSVCCRRQERKRDHWDACSSRRRPGDCFRHQCSSRALSFEASNYRNEARATLAGGGERWLFGILLLFVFNWSSQPGLRDAVPPPFWIGAPPLLRRPSLRSGGRCHPKRSVHARLSPPLFIDWPPSDQRGGGSVVSRRVPGGVMQNALPSRLRLFPRSRVRAMFVHTGEGGSFRSASLESISTE